MIKIGKPFVYDDGNYAYLKAKIEISKDTSAAYLAASKIIKKVHWRTSDNYPPIEWQSEDSGLWFAVPIEYKNFLCAERSDAFVVAMLWYAMITGSDIMVEEPMSEQMAFNVQQFLIPALCTPEKGRRRIKLLGPTVCDILKNAGAVGTGMSCGVDSLYTLHEYNCTNVPMNYRLTHLTYYNMGAIFHPNRSEPRKYSLKEFYQTTDKMSLEKCENAQKVAEMAGLPLIYVKSNLDSDYYRGAYGHTGVYRNCAMTLSLQKLFSKYYNSSGGWPNFFNLCLTEGSAQYEKMLLQCLSTESLQFILSDYATRIEKTKVIADDPIAKKFLDVCFCFNNCGKCSKCRRTLVTLDVLGKIDNFNESFNIEEFKRDRINSYFWLLKTKDGDDKNDDAEMARAVYNFAIAKNAIPSEAISKYEQMKLKNRFKQLVKRLIKR